MMKPDAPALFLGLAVLGAPQAAANDLGRDRDPVVLMGSDLATLLGDDPALIVAFDWSGGWVQAPVQVDERAVVDFGTIYNGSPTGQTLLTYTDPSTFTGPDPDPTLDADDEIVFMARHAGPRRGSGPPPAGTVAGTGVEIRVENPLNDEVAYVYLFLSDGSLDPGAGQRLVTYEFRLLSGDYKSTYDTRVGPNPEDSRVSSAAYGVHFSDRWIRDGTSVLEGGATGVDILDRHKNLFGPGECGRSEDTFSEGEGAFIVNRSGPVRALRGYVGANSGPTTHRIHRFYEAREDVLTVLRVHPIPGIMDYFDYEPAASGMTYRNDVNTGGVQVDGVQDNVAPGPILWEMVTGAQGTLAMSHLVLTDIPGFSYTSYYSDRTEPTVTQCTGDPYEYGASGLWINEIIPNTDPAGESYFVLEGTRVIKYTAPDQPASFASSSDAEARTPLTTTATPLSSDCPDADADGYAACDASCSVPVGKACGDCDDASASVHPGQVEPCNGVDDDCDVATADGSDESWLGQACDGQDADLCAEGQYACSGGQKSCSDSSGNTPEVCGNGQDDDCDGKTDSADPDCALPPCPDADGDGYVACGGSCSVPAGKTCGDCDDASASVHPGQVETCNGVDDDCDGGVDEGLDGDGDSSPDCADNCPGTSNPEQADFDGDGRGDACETGSALADANLSGRVDGFDLADLARAFGSRCQEPRYDADVDFTRSCLVDGEDLAVLAVEFGKAVPP